MDIEGLPRCGTSEDDLAGCGVIVLAVLAAERRQSTAAEAAAHARRGSGAFLLLTHRGRGFFRQDRPVAG